MQHTQRATTDDEKTPQNKTIKYIADKLGIWYHVIKELDCDGFHRRIYIHSKNEKQTINIEFSFPSRFSHLYFICDQGEPAVKVGIASPLFALWLGYEAHALYKIFEKFIPKYGSRELGVRIHDEGLYWKIWRDPHLWSSTDSKWRDGSFNFVNFLLGKTEHTEQEISETSDIDIPMPEGNYKATIKMLVATWKRPRWYATKKNQAEIFIPEGIPTPHKYGDDACNKHYCQANNPGEAVGEVVKTILYDRWRKGRWDYLLPKEQKLMDILK